MPCGTLTENNPNTTYSTRSNVVQGGAPTVTSHPYLSDVSERTTTGQCISGFFKKKREGKLLGHTYFRSQELSGSASGARHHTHHFDAVDDSVFTEDFWIAGNLDWIASESDANGLELPEADYFVQAAAGAIYGKFHDSLTFIAELHKIRSLWEGLARDVITFDIGKLNLRYRYGLRPLIADIESIQDAIENLNSQRKIYTERRGESVVYEFDSQDDPFDAGPGMWTYFRHRKVEISVRGSVAGLIDPPKFSFNPVVTAWELVPWSFVVDWVINIGQWIAAISFLMFNQKFTASAGYQYTITRNMQGRITAFHDTYEGSWASFGSSTLVVQERIPTSVPRYPILRVRLDPWKALDLFHLLFKARGKQPRFVR
jgi:hypothetical protein